MITTHLLMHGHNKWLGWSKGQRCVRIFSHDGARTTCGTCPQLSLSYTQRTQRPGNMTTPSVLNVNQNPANL